MRSPLLTGVLFTLLLAVHIVTVLSMVQNSAPMQPAATLMETAS